MGIPDLPGTYAAWQVARAQHLARNLAASPYTQDLYRQYRKHLGGPRYWLLRAVQALITPGPVRQLLGLAGGAAVRPAVALYCATRQFALSQWAKSAMLPADYRARIRALDAAPADAAAPVRAGRCPMGYA